MANNRPTPARTRDRMERRIERRERPRDERVHSPRSGQPARAVHSRGPWIKVRAITMGYYGHIRRREGDVFKVRDGDISSRWMERVGPDTPEQITTGQQELRRKHDEIIQERTPAQGTSMAEDIEENPLGV